MQIDGHCHCGNITFEAEASLDKVGICHCTDCQILSGAPYNAFVQVQETEFTLKSGIPKAYFKIADSGNKRVQMFCPECGTRIYTTMANDVPDGEPRKFSLRLGVVSQRDKLTPKWQLWHRSAQPWTKDLNSIPAVETQPNL